MLREARQADVPRLVEILRLSPEAGSWSETELQQAVAGRGTRQCFVAEREGRVWGFLLVERPAAEETEILTLAIDPSARRRGLARELLTTFLCAPRGRVFLEVRQSNAAAQQLYRGLGFVAVGVRRGYYSSPVEDAIVMQLICNQ